MSETEKNVPNVREMLSNERIFANLVELILQVRNWQFHGTFFCPKRDFAKIPLLLGFDRSWEVRMPPLSPAVLPSKADAD